VTSIHFEGIQINNFFGSLQKLLKCALTKKEFYPPKRIDEKLIKCALTKKEIYPLNIEENNYTMKLTVTLHIDFSFPPRLPGLQHAKKNSSPIQPASMDSIELNFNQHYGDPYDYSTSNFFSI